MEKKNCYLLTAVYTTIDFGEPEDSCSALRNLGVFEGNIMSVLSNIKKNIKADVESCAKEDYAWIDDAEDRETTIKEYIDTLSFDERSDLSTLDDFRIGDSFEYADVDYSDDCVEIKIDYYLTKI